MNKINNPLRTGFRAWTKCWLMLLAVFALVNTVKAQPDYAPAIWNPAYPGHWYTSGNGHKFVVIHDMEGYYLSTISYFQQSGTSASVHYCVNGVKDSGSDAPAGEITQMVRESYYAWHALCWNTYSFGTEHEGFVSNPAWYTYDMYTASAGLQRHLCDVWGIAKDRNHVVGHDEKKNTAWVNWVNTSSGWGVDPTCNTHTDPGQYWDWSYFMALINNTPYNKSEVVSILAPSNVDPGTTFNATVTFKNTGTTTWAPGTYFFGSQNPQDNTRWGFNRVSLTANAAPGANCAVTFTCTAPSTAAIYPFEWKMVQEGVEWFGPTAATTINVGNAQPVADIIVDNPAALVSGTWSTGTSSADKYGTDYRFHSQGTGGNNLQYSPNILTPGDYNVYEWHPQGSNRSAGTPHVVTYNGGTATVNVNQQINGGQWNLIGTYNFLTGTAGNIKITDGFTDGTQVAIADALKFVYVPGGGEPPPPTTPPAAPSGLTATAVSTSQINLTWTDNATNENNFVVSRSATSGGPYTDIATLAADVTSYNNSGLASGTTYYYVVRAVNTGGASANSNEASATTQTPPPVPAVHVQSITMSWVAAGNKFKARAVVRVVDSTGAAVNGATVTGDFTGSIRNSSLSAATTATGDATITSSSSIKVGTVTFTITDITGTNMTYDSAANVVTSNSISR